MHTAARTLAVLGFALGAALLSDCNSPDARLGPGQDAGAETSADGQAGCTANTGCASDPGGPVCDTSRGVCVACNENGDCGGALTCNVASHQCVGCGSDQDCPFGSICELASSTCVAGCSPTQPCSGALVCCSDRCANTLTTAAHCGGCDQGCGVGKSCVNGACTVGSGCPAPFEDCDGVVANGCETNLLTNALRCGSCTTACSEIEFCDNGSCGPCPAETRDCDRHGPNGCEISVAADSANCGACAARCGDDSHCSGGKCTACGPDTSDCDKDGANGCECPRPICECEGKCQTKHSNGAGQFFYDCVPLGTYNLEQAMKACGAYTGDPLKCVGQTCGAGSAVCTEGGAVTTCWGYSGTIAGKWYSAQGAQVCPIATDPDWT